MTSFMIELAHEDHAGWSATLPDDLGLPRHLQGLGATNRADPAEALEGLAAALRSAAVSEMGLDLADLHAGAGGPAPVAGIFGELNADQAMMEGR